jgi:ABC-type multidrug transport system ATPase subunit
MIIDHGRTLASGTLDDLRALSAQMFRVSLTFSDVDPTLRRRLESLNPVELRIEGKSAEMLFRGEQSSLLSRLAEVSQSTAITHFEVRGADLEEIFVAVVENRK